MQVFPLVLPRALRWAGLVAAATLGLAVALFVAQAILFGLLAAAALFFDGRFAAGGAILTVFALSSLSLDYFVKRSRGKAAPRSVRVPRVCVGADGIAVHAWSGPARFHSWSVIRGAQRSGGQVSIALESGADERVRVRNAEALVELIEKAKARQLVPRAARVRVFEPDGELDARWLERVRRVGAEQGYRQENVGEPALLDLVDDAAQPAAQRIAAALALAHASVETKRRVRVAIDDTADPELGRVLDEALSDELEPRSLTKLERR